MLMSRSNQHMYTDRQLDLVNSKVQKQANFTTESRRHYKVVFDINEPIGMQYM